MTGFGRGKYEKDGRQYTIEIKSVNHKYSDISIRMPKILSGMEDKIRKKMAECISRGKIDVFINFERDGNLANTIHFNTELAKEYVKGLRELSKETGIEYVVNIMDIAQMPEILKVEQNEIEETIEQELMVALEEALKNFVEMRQIEGQSLLQDMQKRILIIQQKVEEIERYSGTLVKEYIQKLEARVKEFMDTKIVDENRLAQEIVIFSDKSSIEEELTRLKSHLEQFHQFCKQASPIGKKFDFLIQEMNREINTIGSKANCLEITNCVIEVKTQIENIREQIQNIE